MGIIKKLKDKYFIYRSDLYIFTGEFDKALKYVKKLSSHKLQKKHINYSLGKTLLLKIKQGKKDYVVYTTTNKLYYDQFRATVGALNSQKCVVYQDPNGEIQGLEKVVEQTIPENNPLREYLDELNGR